MSLLPGLMDSFLDSRCGYEVKRESNPINDSSGCKWFLKWLHFAPTRTNHIKCVSCEMSMVDCYYWYQIDTGRVQYNWEIEISTTTTGSVKVVVAVTCIVPFRASSSLSFVPSWSTIYDLDLQSNQHYCSLLKVTELVTVTTGTQLPTHRYQSYGDHTINDQQQQQQQQQHWGPGMSGWNSTPEIITI